MIRLATPEDATAIFALEQTVQEAAHWSAAEYAQMLQPQDEKTALRRWVYVCEDGGVAGFIVVKLLRMGKEAQAEIENLAVSPAARRRGTGSALCRKALQELHREGARRVELEVRAGNLAALALYRSMGFETTGIRPDYYSKPKEDAQLLCARLPVPDIESAGLIMRIDG